MRPYFTTPEPLVVETLKRSARFSKKFQNSLKKWISSETFLASVGTQVSYKSVEHQESNLGFKGGVKVS